MNVAVEVDTATPADAPSLAAVHAASAAVAYADIFPADSDPPAPADLKPDWKAMIESEDWQVFVARRVRVDEPPSPAPDAASMSGRSILGGVAVGPEPTVPAGWLLSRLYVHPDHWAGGAGSVLHDRAVATMPVTGALNLWVLEHNVRGRRFYERRGWSLVPGRYLANDPPHIRDVLYQHTSR